MEHLLDEHSKALRIATEQQRIIGILVSALEKIRGKSSLPDVWLTAEKALKETGYIKKEEK